MEARSLDTRINGKLNDLCLGNRVCTMKYENGEALALNLSRIGNRYEWNVEANIIVIKEPSERSGTPRFKGRIEDYENCVVVNGTFSISFFDLLATVLWYIGLIITTILCLFGVLNVEFLKYVGGAGAISFAIHCLNMWGSRRAMKKMKADLESTQDTQ